MIRGMMSKSTNTKDELGEIAPLKWLLDDLCTTILDASAEELPELYSKLEALASAISERYAKDRQQLIDSLINEETIKARIDELDKVQELGKDNVTTFQGIIKFRLTELKERENSNE